MNTYRLTAATCLVLPAATNTVLHVVDPLSGDTTSKLVTQAAAHPALTSLMQLQYVMLLFAPGALLLGYLARGAPRLAYWGAALFCVGALANFADLVGNSIYSVVGHSSDPRGWLVKLNALDTSTHTGVLAGMEIAGIALPLVGTLLLAAALLRSKAVARWVAWLLCTAEVSDLVGHIVELRPVVVVAWLMFTVAYAGCCLRMVALPWAPTPSRTNRRELAAA